MNLRTPAKIERTEKIECGQEWLLRIPHKGSCSGILTDLRVTDEEDFRKFLRMNTAKFQVKVSNVFFRSSH